MQAGDPATTTETDLLSLRSAPSPVRIVATALACALMAGCATAPLKTARVKDPKYGVYASPRVVDGEGPIDAAHSRRGVYMVGKPYVVAGKRYIPRESTSYAATGTASWYGTNFHGRLTANGEVFDMHDITAAHPTMPLPSYARVTNLTNGDSLVVRVNDRGPYHGGRVIDVSQRAADLLDFKRAGIGRVKVEYLGRARQDVADTAMLVASLRTDGGPAQMPAFGRDATTMIAQATPPPPLPVPSDAPAPVAEAPVLVAQAAMPVIATDAPVTMASAADTPLPPVRPGTAVETDADTAPLIQLAAYQQPAPSAAMPSVMHAAATSAETLTAETAAYGAGVMSAPIEGPLDLATIPNAATPIPGKVIPQELARPAHIPLPPQRSAALVPAGKRVAVGPARLTVADIVGRAATLGDTPMVAPVLAYAEAAPSVALAPAPAREGVFVDSGVFDSAAQADDLRWVLSQAGDARLVPADADGNTWRVEAGPFADRASAAAAVTLARGAGAIDAAIED